MRADEKAANLTLNFGIRITEKGYKGENKTYTSIAQRPVEPPAKFKGTFVGTTKA